MKRQIYLFLPLLMIFTLFLGCEEESAEPAGDDILMELASTDLSDVNLKVKVFAEQDLQVGYNRVQIKLNKLDSDASVTDANIKLIPMMHMTNMMHTTPVNIPDESLVDNMYQRDVVFIMPSGDMGFWELMIEVDMPAQGIKDTATVGIEVNVAQEATLQSLISKTDSSSLFISLVEPRNPDVGANDFKVMVHRRASMMSFPPVEDLQIEIEPEMPTMGHGSEGNINPTHTRNGQYEGTVSFNMTGFWRINITLLDGENREVGKTAFEMTF